MNEIISAISWIYSQTMNLWQSIYDYKYTIYILFGLIIVLFPFIGKVKIKFLSGIINFIYAIAILLLTSLAIAHGYEYFKNYQETHPDEQITPTQQPVSSEEYPDIYGIEPDIQNNDQYQGQTTKQLYYSVSCSSCYAEGCPSNGYYYAGYDGGSYAYYYGLCQSCSCSSVVGHSFWK